MSYWDDVHRVFGSTAARARQNTFLHRLQPRASALQPFADGDALLRFLHEPRTNRDVKDAALLALVQAHQMRRRGGQAFSLLLAAMMPMLDRLYRWRRPRGEEATIEDDDEVWADILAAFTQALDHYPVARRPKKVAANIQGETLAALRRASERDRRLMDAHERRTEELAAFFATGLRRVDRHGQVRAECTVEADGFTFAGTKYNSLSGAAMAAAKSLGLTSKTQNGFSFWGLDSAGARPARTATPKALDFEGIESAFKRYRERAQAATQGVRDEDRAKLQEMLAAHSKALLDLNAAVNQPADATPDSDGAATPEAA